MKMDATFLQVTWWNRNEPTRIGKTLGQAPAGRICRLRCILFVSRFAGRGIVPDYQQPVQVPGTWADRPVVGRVECDKRRIHIQRWNSVEGVVESRESFNACHHFYSRAQSFPPRITRARRRFEQARLWCPSFRSPESWRERPGIHNDRNF